METEGIVLTMLLGIGLPVILGSIIAFIYIKWRHSERMEMIRQGIMPVEPRRAGRKINRYAALRNGLVMIGMGLGVIVGLLLMPVLGVNEQFALVTATLFGGIGFVVYYFMSQKTERPGNDNDEKSKLID